MNETFRIVWKWRISNNSTRTMNRQKLESTIGGHGSNTSWINKSSINMENFKCQTLNSATDGRHLRRYVGETRSFTLRRSLDYQSARVGPAHLPPYWKEEVAGNEMVSSDGVEYYHWFCHLWWRCIPEPQDHIHFWVRFHISMLYRHRCVTRMNVFGHYIFNCWIQ